MDPTPNGSTATQTPEAAEAARKADIEAARPAWARKATPASGTEANPGDKAPGGGVAPQKSAEAKPDLKTGISAAAARAEGKPAGAPIPKIDPKTGVAEPKAGADDATDAKKPVKVVFPVMGRQISVDMTKEEADFLERNPRFKAQIQKSLGAEIKFDEASRREQQTKQIFEMFKDKSQIERALRALGHEDPRAVMEELLYKHIEVERMNPQEKELHESREKLRAMEAEKESRVNAEKEAEQKRLTEHYSGEYQKAIIGAVSKSGLPATEETVGRVAFYMNAALTQLGKELTPEQVIPLVREDYQKSLRRFVTAADATVIGELLGEDGLKKVREFELGRLNGKKLPFVPPQKGPVKGVENAPPAKKAMSVDEFRERNARIKSGELVVGQ